MTVTADTVPIPRLAPSAPPVLRALTRGERCALACLLLGTAVLYLWDLGSAGWANIYYAGAVQAMTQDWTAFLFGSTDAGNTVTVDTPPGSLWVMASVARVFGLSTWSLLVPQALIGVCAVAVLHAAVRQAAGPVGGLVAGAVLALTPVAVGMFRHNEPDALLVLLLVAAAYAVVRATRTANTGWLLIAGALVGFAFLTKTAHALLPLPAMALAYLVAAPTGFGRRVRQLLAAGVAIVLAGGWWFAIVELSPADGRPYIGGSRTDSALELALAGVRVQNGPGSGSDPGILRMVDAQHAPLVGSLLPTALALLLVGLWVGRRAKRTETTRASLLLWGGWTVITALVFSLADGIGHSYDTVALAPGIAALVGIGGALLWERRRSWAGRTAFALLVAATAGWVWVLLGRTPEFLPSWRWVVVTATALAVLALLVRPGAGRTVGTLLTLTFTVTALTGPAALAARAVAEGDRDGIPGMTPTTAPGRADQAADTPGAELVTMLRATSRKWSAATVGAQNGAALALASGTSVMGIGGFSGRDPAPTLEEFQDHVAAREVRWFVEGGAGPATGATPSSEITAWVREKFEPTVVGDHTVYDLDPPLP